MDRVAVQVLTKAKERIARPKGWYRGSFVGPATEKDYLPVCVTAAVDIAVGLRDDTGAVDYVATGRLAPEQTRNVVRDQAVRYLYRALPELDRVADIGEGRRWWWTFQVARYNDTHRKDEVLELVNRAIEIAVEQ